MKHLNDIIQESILDNSDDVLKAGIETTLKDWMMSTGWELKSINSYWKIEDDGSLILTIPTVSKMVYFRLTEDTKPFPGIWKDTDDYKYDLNLRDNFGWKNHNLPPVCREVNIDVNDKIKLDLTGLQQCVSLKINLNSRNLPSIKFDPKLKVNHLEIADGVWGNENLSNFKIKLPEGANMITLDKKIGEGMLSKVLGTTIKLK